MAEGFLREQQRNMSRQIRFSLLLPRADLRKVWQKECSYDVFSHEMEVPNA